MIRPISKRNVVIKNEGEYVIRTEVETHLILGKWSPFNRLYARVEQGARNRAFINIMDTPTFKQLTVLFLFGFYARRKRITRGE